jgi:hypothetical protein
LTRPEPSALFADRSGACGILPAASLRKSKISVLNSTLDWRIPVARAVCKRLEPIASALSGVRGTASGSSLAIRPGEARAESSAQPACLDLASQFGTAMPACAARRTHRRRRCGPGVLLSRAVVLTSGVRSPGSEGCRPTMPR